MTRGSCGWIGVALIATFHMVPTLALAQPAGLPPLEVGRKIYAEGLLPSGELLRGTVQGDVTLTGEQASCSSCHRPSGFGSIESGSVVPPVVGAELYRRKLMGAPETGRIRTVGPGTRPAYDRDSLIRAIRNGVNPAGRRLDPLMPRFQLSESEASALVTYLESLDPGPSPGVTGAVVHIATIVTENLDPARREALLGTLRAFEADRNADTRIEESRRERGSWDSHREYGSYRKWALHVWELRGSESSWPAQLEDYYRLQPVFAVLSGAASGSWQPIHEFCETKRLPCLFPVTDLPYSGSEGKYTIYFSRGLALEAEALAVHLLASRAAPPRVLQVFREGTNGAFAAAALRRAVAATPGTTLVNQPLEPHAHLDAGTMAAWIEEHRPTSLVLWLGTPDIAPLASGPRTGSDIPIYLSATLLPGGAAEVPADWRETVLLTYPFGMPEQVDPRLARPELWLKARGVAGERRARLEAFFAATMLSEAQREVRDVFVREYLIERIEHMVDRSVKTTQYPRLTLGPGERFASKGCYIVRPGASGATVVPVSEWIVP
jgi:hypothetical protein